MMTDDMDLLRGFVTRQSDSAFSELVALRVKLVHSAALRQVRDPHLAEEITQAVFIILARKAKSLGRKTFLPGWLHRTTRYVAADALRTQRRRQIHEHEAYMQSTLTDPHEEAAWQQLSPVLDEAMARLRPADRDALLLRYFENKTLSEVGAGLGTSEEAAKKRVARGLEKLRVLLAKRGVTLSAAVIASTVTANSVQAVPAGLAASVTAAAAKGTGVATSTLALAKATLNRLLWAKIKSAASLGAGLLAVGSAVMLTVVKTGRLSGVVVEYEAEGTMEYRTTDSRTATVFMSREYNFRMSVSGARWFLMQMPTRCIWEGEPSLMEAYSVASSDGTNFYFVTVAPEAAARAAKARNVAFATIRSGSVPVDTVPPVGLLWYALASGAYFARDVTNEHVIGVSPFPDKKYYLKDFRTKAFWELEAQPPRLPRKLTFTGDYMFLHQQPDPGFQQHLRPTNWMYQSIEFTNVGDLWLPKQGAASLADFGPLQTTFRFAVTNLNRACSVAIFKPKFPGPTAVSDYRAISTELPVGVAAGIVSDWPKAEATKARAAKILRDRRVVGSRTGPGAGETHSPR
jgi:RNA polymerase sigma factor (sigma-70 family)